MKLLGSLPVDFLLGVIRLLRLPLADFLARLRGGGVELPELARVPVDLRADFFAEVRFLLGDLRADFLLGIARAVPLRWHWTHSLILRCN